MHRREFVTNSAAAGWVLALSGCYQAHENTGRNNDDRSPNRTGMVMRKLWNQSVGKVCVSWAIGNGVLIPHLRTSDGQQGSLLAFSIENGALQWRSNVSPWPDLGQNVHILGSNVWYRHIKLPENYNKRFFITCLSSNLGKAAWVRDLELEGIYIFHRETENGILVFAGRGHPQPSTVYLINPSDGAISSTYESPLSVPRSARLTASGGLLYFRDKRLYHASAPYKSENMCQEFEGYGTIIGSVGYGSNDLAGSLIAILIDDSSQLPNLILFDVSSQSIKRQAKLPRGRTIAIFDDGRLVVFQNPGQGPDTDTIITEFDPNELSVIGQVVYSKEFIAPWLIADDLVIGTGTKPERLLPIDIKRKEEAFAVSNFETQVLPNGFSWAAKNGNTIFYQIGTNISAINYQIFWNRAYKDRRFVCGPILGPGYAITAFRNRINAIRVDSGLPLWSVPTTQVLSKPARSFNSIFDRIFCLTSNGVLVIQPDGKVDKMFPTLPFAGAYSLFNVGEYLICAIQEQSNDLKVRAINKEGEVKWEHSTTAKVGSGFAFDQEAIFFIDADGACYGCGYLDIKINWRQKIKAIKFEDVPPVILKDWVFVLDTNGTIFTFDRKSGAILDSDLGNNNKMGLQQRAMISIEGDLIVISSDNRVRRLDAKSGYVKWKTEESFGHIFQLPVIVRKHLFIFSSDTIIVLDIQSGALVRMLNIEQAGAPGQVWAAANSEVVLVVTESGLCMALRP